MTELLEKFYSSFKNLDPESMVSCYHEDIEFEDPAFGKLKGERAKNMWRMLCQSQKGKEFIVDYSEIESDDKSGSAHWEAHYKFSATGRQVHNKINAKFEFKEGKIIKHKDSFHLKKWAGMALGFKGKMIGGTGFFKKKLNQQTGRLLDKYEKSIIK